MRKKLKKMFERSYKLSTLLVYYRIYEEKINNHLINEPVKNSFLLFLKFLYSHFGLIVKILTEEALVIRQIEIPVTLKCSLNCENCSNLMQFYEKPYDVDIDVNKNAILRLLEISECILNVIVLGGEPLIYTKLDDWLIFLSKQEKIKKIQVFTNGTIVPSETVLNILEKNKDKIHVIISNYGDISRKIEELEKAFILHNVSYETKFEGKYEWRALNGVKCRNRKKHELHKQFIQCHNVCRSMLNGELHFCPISSNGVDLGLIPRNKDDYVDILDSNILDEELKKKVIKFLYRMPYSLTACNYCDAGTDNVAEVQPGVQIPRKSSLN